MRNLIPSYINMSFKLNEFIDDNKEAESKGMLKCSCGCDSFKIIREKWEPSQERDEAYSKLQELYKKYGSDKRYPTGNFVGIITNHKVDGKTYVVYKPYPYNSKIVILEDTTELDRIILNNIGRIPTLILAQCSSCNKTIEVFNSSKHGYDGVISEKKVDFETIKTKKIPKCRKCGHEERIVRIEFHYADFESVREDLGEKADVTNAFDWITIHLECANCNNIQKNYLDLETM